MKQFIASLSKVKFVRDVATMQVGQIFNLGSGFVASILYARLLGLEEYGVYAMVLAFTGILSFVTNLGQRSTALTFLSEAIGKKDDRRIKEVLHYYWFLSGCSMAILLLLLPFPPMITSAMYGNARIGELSQIILVSSTIDFFFVFGTIVLQSVREIRKLTVLENSRIVLQLVLAILFLSLGMGAKGILLGMLFGTGLMSLVSMYMYCLLQKKYGLPPLSSLFLADSYGHIRQLSKDGIWMAINKNIGNLYPNIFLVILGIFTRESVVGLVRLAFKLGNLPVQFGLTNISRLSQSVIPTLISSGGSVKKSLSKLALYATCIHIASSACALIIVPPLLPIVYGQSFGVAVFPFIIIVILHGTSVVHMLIAPILRLYSRVYVSVAFSVAAFIISIAAFFVLATHIKPTFALYTSLSIYHFVALLTVIPTIQLIRKHQAV